VGSQRISGSERVELNGGSGDDNMLLKAYWNGMDYGIFVGYRSTLDLTLNGQAGADTLDAWYWGEADGTVNVRVDGNQNSADPLPYTPGPVPDGLGGLGDQGGISGSHDGVGVSGGASLGSTVNTAAVGPAAPSGPIVPLFDDDIKVRCQLKVYAGSTGDVTGRSLGGGGDDGMAFSLTDNSGGAADVTAILFGGAGHDTLLFASPGVTPISVEA
jgi:hypothetical protein